MTAPEAISGSAAALPAADEEVFAGPATSDVAMTEAEKLSVLRSRHAEIQRELAAAVGVRDTARAQLGRLKAAGAGANELSAVRTEISEADAAIQENEAALKELARDIARQEPVVAEERAASAEQALAAATEEYRAAALETEQAIYDLSLRFREAQQRLGSLRTHVAQLAGEAARARGQSAGDAYREALNHLYPFPGEVLPHRAQRWSGVMTAVSTFAEEHDRTIASQSESGG